MTKNLTSSVHQRLMNRAKAERRPFNEAIRATFEQRQTALVPAPTAFGTEFAAETARQRPWTSF